MLEIIIAQIIVVLINIYIAKTENKTKIYLVTFLFNLANLIMYFLNDDKATVILYIIITIRSFIYIFKDKLKTWIIPVFIIIIQLIIGFMNMENIWQLIPILTPCIVCYYMWFCKTTQQLRIWNAICHGLWVIYNIKTGLYIAMIGRIVSVLANIIEYFKNKKTALS